MLESPFKDYYLYNHRDPVSQIIIYIGIGTKDRAWYMRNRHKDHLDWLNQKYKDGYLMTDIANIIEKDLFRKEALQKELELIDAFRPKFNRNYQINDFCKLDEKSFALAYKLREEGWYYKRIADELGVSAMTIHRALNGGSKKYEDFFRQQPF